MRIGNNDENYTPALKYWTEIEPIAEQLEILPCRAERQRAPRVMERMR